VASQTLLGLVVRLQQVMSIAQGRAMLLDYARKSCGARLALLFVLDRERQALTLLEQSGRRPASSSASLETSPVDLSLQGLFASALDQRGFLDIPDISRNPLSLPEERVWAWPRGRVLLHALRQGTRQGVLVFCFSPSGARSIPTADAQDELLICASLLSAYLGGEEEPPPIRKYTEPSERARRQARRGTRAKTVKSSQEILPEEGPAPETGPEEKPPMQFDEVLSLLIALCELGLTTGEQMDQLTLNQQILGLLSSALRSPAGYLWLYQPAQEAFLLQSTLGEPDAFAEYATTEMNRVASTFEQAGKEPAYGLITLPNSGERILVWQTLNYREQLLGALGMVLAQEPVLLLDQRLLLNAACDIVALLLLHYEQRRDAQRELIEQERSRIAREMHDSVMQDVAHVTQKLDYIQRILEKQPQVALNEIEQARELLDRSLRDLRNGISSLLPGPLEEQEFDEALKALLHEYSLNSPHIKITYDVDNLALWPQALQAPIYRFMQEALNNIRKHAAASEVSIRIRHVAGLGVVQVSDNGQGFVPEQVRKSLPEPLGTTLHMGLQTMEERIRQAGGALEIHSAPGEGTTLKARFPLTQSSAILTEREREVLRLMVEGLTNRAISERLSVSLETVKSHVHHIMQKMQVKDRTQAAVVATKQRWL
jgi:signal transduction histidine kinase/DNA-binding CsgD family transcriptional regulator